MNRYKYKGGDNGIAYQYLYNPLASYLVEHLPESLAPNTITLIGFIFSILPCFLLFSLYGTHFSGPISTWWCLLQALFYFLYRLLDELDGKQARRTNNSTPLGLQFDHGCDSFTLGSQGLMAAKVLQIGDNWLLLLMVLCACLVFHCAIIEEYYTGGLFQPRINAITDGSLVIIFIYVALAIFGNEFLVVEYEWDMGEDTVLVFTIAEVFCFLLLLFGVFSLIRHFVNILTFERDEQSGHSEAKFEWLSFVIIYMSLPAIGALWVSASLIGEEPIVETDPLITTLLMVFIFVENTLHMQTAHVTYSEYWPWNAVYVINFVGLTAYLVSYLANYQFNDFIFFSTLLGITCFLQWLYIFCMIYEMSHALRIRVFFVKNRTSPEDPLL